MNHQREQSHGQSTTDSSPDHDDVEPGRASRSGLMRKPDHALASGLVQRKARDGNGVAEGADQAVAAASSSGGSSLPETLMRKFEGSLGADLSGVRVHTGESSATANDAVVAKAYTIGQDIHFGAGHYDPSSPGGEHLLAHEVAHTVQQSGGAQRMQFKLSVSSPGDSLEHEADRAADAMISGQPTSLGSGLGGIAREAKASSAEKKPATKDEAKATELLVPVNKTLAHASDAHEQLTTLMTKGAKYLDKTLEHYAVIGEAMDKGFERFIETLKEDGEKAESSAEYYKLGVGAAVSVGGALIEHGLAKAITPVGAAVFIKAVETGIDKVLEASLKPIKGEFTTAITPAMKALESTKTILAGYKRLTALAATAEKFMVASNAAGELKAALKVIQSGGDPAKSKTMSLAKCEQAVGLLGPVDKDCDDSDMAVIAETGVLLDAMNLAAKQAKVQDDLAMERECWVHWIGSHQIKAEKSPIQRRLQLFNIQFLQEKGWAESGGNFFTGAKDTANQTGLVGKTARVLVAVDNADDNNRGRVTIDGVIGGFRARPFGKPMAEGSFGTILGIDSDGTVVIDNHITVAPKASAEGTAAKDH